MNLKSIFEREFELGQIYYQKLSKREQEDVHEHFKFMALSCRTKIKDEDINYCYDEDEEVWKYIIDGLKIFFKKYNIVN